jgi:hypothetical protein
MAVCVLSLHAAYIAWVIFGAFLVSDRPVPLLSSRDNYVVSSRSVFGALFAFELPSVIMGALGGRLQSPWNARYVRRKILLLLRSAENATRPFQVQLL